MAKPDAIKPVNRSKHIFMCVYGWPGTGKTVLAGSTPNTLIIRPPTDHTDSIPDQTNVEEWVVNDWDEMNDVEEYLRHDGKNHDWVWLDSISLFQDTGLDDIWAATIARKPDRKQFGADKGEYGINMQRLSRWVRSAVGVDQYNFGITAHPFEGEDALTGRTVLKPYVQGKNMSDKVQACMNIVAYYEKVEQGEKDDRKIVRVLRTADSDRYDSKDQLEALTNGRMIDPTIPKIVKNVEAARKRKGGATSKSTKKRPAKRRRATS